MEEKRCRERASHRYTWPGKNETFACLRHTLKIAQLAEALGMRLQLIPVELGMEDHPKCTQVLSEHKART